MLLSPHRLPNSAYRDINKGRLRPNALVGSGRPLDCPEKRGKGQPMQGWMLTSNARPSLHHSAASMVPPALPAGVEDAPPADTASSSADVTSIIADGVQQMLDAEISPVSVDTRTWVWEGHSIRYQVSGEEGPALLLIHGFGANCDHWRRNIPVLAQSHRVFAIDLLGYGYSDKPDPKGQPPNSLYTFETWSRQARAFLEEVVGAPAFLICNSVGGLVGLQAALDSPPQVRGLLLLNISLRQLHVTKQEWFAKPFVKALQTTLRRTDIGKVFFKSVAKPQAIKNILRQCYHDKDQVTDELVQVILEPGLRPGAADVFLDFICYSGGPLPEELLPLVQCPVLIGWGEEDPWEPVKLGRAYGEIATVDEFVVLPGVGHCPQDEAPHLVNPLITRFVAKYS